MARARFRIAAVVLLAVLSACTVAEGPQSNVTPGPPVTTKPVDPAVADLMDGTGMTPAARRLFVDASPSLEDKDALAQSCATLAFPASDSATAHTYGCVVGGKVHIRLFSAPELSDMKYVVAAHELLHLVYGNLGTAEKVRIDAELDQARTGNAALAERLEVYAASAADTPNEVHAVLGTEFADLSPELEAHYAEYFSRSLVLAEFKRTLGDREEAIRQLHAKVDDMKKQLDAMSADMEALRAAGDIRTFNARVPVYNALVQQHNAAVAQLQQLVDAHKALVSS
jgi:hypothetical protein